MNKKNMEIGRVDFVAQAKEIENILREAGRQARIRHKLLGHPIVSWENGKVVIIPPEEIQIGDEINLPTQG